MVLHGTCNSNKIMYNNIKEFVKVISMQLPEELSSVAVRLRSLLSMVYSGHNLNMWSYGFQSKKLHFSSALYEKELELFFRAGQSYTYAFETAKDFNTPFIMSNAGGMVWLGEYVTVDAASLLILIGPAFYSNTPTAYLDEIVRYLVTNQYIIPQQADQYRSILQDIPVVAPETMLAYARMLHFTITDHPLAASSIHYQNIQPQRDEEAANERADWLNYERVHNQEELILQCVREGNLNYHAVMDNLNFSLLDPDTSTGSTQKAMNWLVLCAAQCCRAAIEGGLSPKIAIPLREEYIRQGESLHTFTELLSLTRKMMDDYIRRVHNAKHQAELTAHIQECCAYIRAHITEELTIQSIAAEIGYTEYYLARKFRKEMGIKILDYIKNIRIEYAKVYLLSTDKSVQEISDLLHFSTRNHFTRVFRELTGITPSQFRSNRQQTSN